ncbi:DUF887-domain-containing protein [Tothia fuscella]|uniref:DUF887-domain-containing protein n=1 Tax=Tothia fuscella TaxID=1048955 RepID=A0A9P4P4N7_9PEZI|nr:DUF887-domain-containing protein [Tothia fuscella]
MEVTDLPPQIKLIMLDPFPKGPAILSNSIRPFSEKIGLTTLHLHIHEILFAALLYEFIFRVASPICSRWLVPSRYGGLNRRNQLNWDAHMVSMWQALFINSVALWVIRTDPQRKVQNRDWKERLWGYNGAAGMVQGFAAGYFLWDVVVSSLHLDVMGLSSLIHAVSALGVTCIGFRPFANYYGLNFVLYELSTPFLNIHWFLDKFGKTGSKAQLYNGILLLLSFGGSRLVWGSYQSALIYNDVWRAWHNTDPFSEKCLGAVKQTLGMQIPVGCRTLPAWLALFYVAANTALSLLNVYWFWKMIAAVRKRFPDDGKRANGSEVMPVGKEVSASKGIPNGKESKDVNGNKIMSNGKISTFSKDGVAVNGSKVMKIA